MNPKYVFVLLCLVFTLGTNAQENKKEMLHAATDIAARMVDHSFDSIPAYFDSTFAKEMTAERLRQNIEGNEVGNGRLLSAEEPELEVFSDKYVMQGKLNFARHSLMLTLTFTMEGRVKSLFVSNYSGYYTIPPYVKSASFQEHKYEFGKKGWEIGGTLSFPDDHEKHPLVIIVHGSGPLDRNGSTGNLQAYKDLAWGLSTNGICVFRYDKRSFVHGGKLFMESYKGNDYTPYDEIVEDVFLAIDLMKKDPHVDTNRIFLVGHSQGGMMLPLIAKQANVRGIMLLAANARPIQDLLIEQMNYLYPDSALTINNYNEKVRIIGQAKFAKKKKLPKDTPMDSLPFGVRASYWNYLNAYDPVKTFKKVTLPVLVLQGERDYQATMADFEIWQKAAKKRKGITTFIAYPKLNHFFVRGEGFSKPAEYQVSGSVDEKVLQDITGWINGVK
jgi:dienelactone hydrolase